MNVSELRTLCQKAISHSRDGDKGKIFGVHDVKQVQFVNSNSRTSKSQINLYANKKLLSEFSAYSDGSPSQLNRISGVPLYTETPFT